LDAINWNNKELASIIMEFIVVSGILPGSGSIGSIATSSKYRFKLNTE
jgi:hypothetical protein